jgi:Tfp pilus assembly protein PilN
VKGIGMASCLGIYIDSNIIKYAKITKEKDDLKVDAFGIKIYSDLLQTIDQIVSETFSFKDQISVNITDEMYDYLYMSDLLSKKDLAKAIETEFESLCVEKQYNPNALESRYAIVNDQNDKTKIKVIHVAENKMKINQILQNFDGKRLQNITPIALTIPNIAQTNEKENALIVNIEDKTSITTLVGSKIYDVQNLDVGAKQILDEINAKENSYLKAYEICKNTTIYTMEGQGLQQQENDYLGYIVPNLFTIANQVKDVIGASLIKINKVYITGTASVINNIDLYFEELLDGIKCEILKPFFIEDSPKINIKDYIEVNSAISLALQGLEYGLANMNFNKKNTWEQLKEALGSDITIGGKKGKDNGKKKININLNSPKVKQWVMRDLFGVLVLLVVYGGLATYINYGIQDKEKEISNTKADINTQITLIDRDKEKINSKTSEYTTLTTNLQNASDAANTKNAYKNVITTFLSEIMYVIPKEVVLTSIENPSARKIVINAQSEKYEQLAYFKALLKSKGVLEPSSVVSSEATKEGSIVKIVIEGELP